MRSQLEALAARYAPAATPIDLTVLRRDAHDCLNLDRRRSQQAWAELNRLNGEARATIRSNIGGGDGSLKLPRPAPEWELRQAIGTSNLVIVTGDSGIGKSALVKAVIEAQDASDDAELQAVMLNLRQLPAQMPTLRTWLGQPLERLLGELSAPNRMLVIDAADFVLESDDQMLRALITAAQNASVSVWVVSATEGLAAVKNAVQKLPGDPLEIDIEGLTDEENLIAWRLNSDYTRILTKLPELLPEFTRALTLLDGTERTQVAQCLVQAYRAADAVADKFGYYDLSAQIIGVMRWAAEQSEDPLAVAVTSYVRGETFFADGQLAAGRRMLERAADQLSPGSSAAASAVYGSLHMRAAVTAARAQLPALARDHLAEAQAIANRVTEGVFLGTAFGPGSVRIHEVTLALDLQEPETALAVAAGWSPPESLPAERRSHFYVDIAQAQLLMGRHEAVLDALHTARTIAPEHIGAHPQVRDTLTMLVRSGKLTGDTAREFLATAQAAADFRG